MSFTLDKIKWNQFQWDYNYDNTVEYVNDKVQIIVLCKNITIVALYLQIIYTEFTSHLIVLFMKLELMTKVTFLL